MIHEILLTLLGHESSVIQETKAGMKVVERIDFLIDHEISLIERAARLGKDFMYLESFVEGVLEDIGISDVDDFGDTSHIISGLYMRAFCSGLDEVLDVYRAMILSIEQEV